MRALPLMALAILGGCDVLPLGGQSPCPGGYECPAAEAPADGLYLVDEDEDRERTLLDPVVEVAGDQVVLAYTDGDGNAWEVVYDVVERFPEE